MNCRFLSGFLPVFLVAALGSGCQSYEEDFEILRNPLIEASIGDYSWKTKDYRVISAGKTLGFDMEGNKSTIYDRLLVYGQTTGKGLEKLAFTVDIADPEKMANHYTAGYNAKGGLHEIVWMSNAGGSWFPCDDQLSKNSFTVTRQRRSEQIISGTFHAVLCNADHPDSLLVIDGAFVDLKYDSR